MEDSERKKSQVPIRKTLSWYWRIARERRWWFIAGFFFYGLGVVFANVFPPIVYKNLVDIIAKGVGSVGSGDVWMWLWVLVGLRIADFVSFRAADVTLVFSQSRTLRDLASFTFDNLQKHSYDFFSNRFSGSLVSQARRYVEAFSTLHDTAIFSVWINAVMFFGMFVSIFLFSPVLAIFFLVSMAVVILVVIPLLKKRWMYDELEAAEDSKVTGRLSDVITNALTVKMFSSSGYESKSFFEHASGQERVRRKSWWAFIVLSTVQNGLLTSLQILGLFLSVWLWYRGEITPGTVVLMQTYLLSVFHIAWDLTHSFSRILKAFANAREMVEIFELPQGIADPEHPEPCRIREGSIEFSGVSFTYDGGDEVFRNFSFSVRTGEKVGLVGPSGGGKSTITKLLLRFADPQEGLIRIDGQDIRTIRQDDLRRAIAYVPQDPLLFHRSLRENIGYGNLDAAETDIVEAAKRAHAHEFIAGLEKGYETLVGERGIKLSGGQRQRIAIARAILKNAPILMLDEATSALDSESEHVIQLALGELMEGKTAIVIAHRLSTIRKLDRIIVLGGDGKVAEEGTHDELLGRDGLYAKLWNRQTGGFIDEAE
jgi:ATP-binding cassette subfamily B protein